MKSATNQSFGSQMPNAGADMTSYSELDILKARRTAFVARFIVLRESKRSRAHRVIEMMEWSPETSAEELSEGIKKIFIANGDSIRPVERDLKRALGHAHRSLNYFVQQYAARATDNFIDALYDYERSNVLLFGNDETPKPGGWRLPKELIKLKEDQKKSNRVQ